MPSLFEEIDSQPSELGEISLRKRVIPVLGPEPIYEVKLGDDYLMSSMFVEAEEQLAHLGLAALHGDRLRVVVGGLGLGYTAVAALQDARVKELLVVDALSTVIGWHEQELVPLGKVLNADSRCRYVLGSFFDLAIGANGGFDTTQPGSEFDAILLDIDHSPSEYLNAGNASFYSEEKLTAMAQQLVSGGVFSMWSQHDVDASFVELLARVFSEVTTHRVTFYNPFQQVDAINTVYVCKK